MTRTFIALEMNEDMQHHLAELIRRMALVLPTVCWVDPFSIHLTLAFLGELDDEHLLKATRASEIVASKINCFL